jgi:hypothetical protein
MDRESKVNQQAIKGNSSKNKAVWRGIKENLGHSQFTQLLHTYIMSGPTVSYVLNRSGGNNLQDEAGYIYKWTRCQKDRSFWISMWQKRFSCPVTIVSSDSTMKILKMTRGHTQQPAP